MQLVVDGMKRHPCDPTNLNARDAIVLADQNNNGRAKQCETWLAVTQYEHRGIAYNDAGDSGVSAITTATTPAQPTEAYSTASSHFTAAGTVTGGLSATWAIDGERRSLTEVGSGGKPSSRYNLLYHEWVINKVPL